MRPLSRSIATAERWAHVLDTAREGTTVALDRGGKLRFAAPSDDRGEGIVAFTAAVAPGPRAGRDRVDLAGVRFELRAAGA